MKASKFGRLRAVFADFLVFILMLIGVGGATLAPTDAYAVVQNTDNSENVVNDNTDSTDNTRENSDENNSDDNRNNSENTTNDNNSENNANNSQNSGASNRTSNTADNNDTCKSSLGALGWLVCPTTGKIAEAVDWLYDKIEDFLVIQPISTEDGTPVYEIWKYCLGLTNLVFVIFLLIVIYSQITGVGISNYGIKKSLPKLIITAILVNLSFLICLLAVDVSNIIGSSLRGLFTSIEESAVTAGAMSNSTVPYSGIYSALAGGSALAIGGAMVAFEAGTIWMLIPVVLGAIVAVASGLITIALRQALVVLLVMISPLAIVAYMLPNTDKWFRKWKDLFTKMLVFYPMFSLLFGASSLAGFAIIMSARDGFGLLLGTAVQIFPLFFSWKLMQMSGTVLGDINTKMRSLTSKPLAGTRNISTAQRIASKQKHLASERPITPSLRLMQFMANQKVAKAEEQAEYANIIKDRGLAYRASKNWEKRNANGAPTKQGEKIYERMARGAEYQRIIERDKNNMNRGLEHLAKNETQKARLNRLDNRTVSAFDTLKVEQARGEKIEFENAQGFHDRMERAINAHMDMEKGFSVTKDGKRTPKESYKFHMDPNKLANSEDLARYNTVHQIMDGNVADVQFAAATAAQGYDTQKKIIETKMQKYFEMAPPTQDVVNRLGELTVLPKASSNIDTIITGLRVLNQRGDTDLVREQVENLLASEGGVELGSHASQSLASFLMFEMKDSDPFLRRFGKYINLETAHVYNTNEKHPEKMRKNKRLSLAEYVTGDYDDYVEEEWVVDETGRPKHTPKNGKAKKTMVPLLEGTSLDKVERTAYKNLDEMLMNAYKDKDGKLDIQRYLDKREEVETSIGPAFISASLKYLSGSEQLKNAVSFLTGYNDKGEARWDKGGDLAGSKKAEEYFRGKTKAYLENQTPTQILGLRSDYYKALSEHLFKEYEETKMENWSPEAIQEREELMRERAEIQTRYGDLPPEEAQEMREKDLADLRKKMIGAQFRQIMDSKGKLNQIYRTRRSGAANNAKDWVREWLELDNEALISMRLNADKDKLNADMEKLRQKKRAEKPTTQGDDDTPSEGGNGIYDEMDRAMFTTYIEDIWQDTKDDGDEAFYETSLKYLQDELGEDSYIVAEYKRFHKDDPYADNHVMKEFLMDLLSDMDNYN